MYSYIVPSEFLLDIRSPQIPLSTSERNQNYATCILIGSIQRLLLMLYATYSICVRKHQL